MSAWHDEVIPIDAAADVRHTRNWVNGAEVIRVRVQPAGRDADWAEVRCGEGDIGAWLVPLFQAASRDRSALAALLDAVVEFNPRPVVADAIARFLAA